MVAQVLAANVVTARAAICDFRPDVIVGSSWGGGIALRLVGLLFPFLLALVVHRFPAYLCTYLFSMVGTPCCLSCCCCIPSTFSSSVPFDLQVAEGVWRGPSILLAPAYLLQHSFCGVDTVRVLPSLKAAVDTTESSPEVTILHSTTDATVPYEDSSKVVGAVSRSSWRLVTVDDDHRLDSVFKARGPVPPQMLQLLTKVAVAGTK